MKNLIIIGARGAGRETFEMAKVCPQFGTEWDIKGFLDDNAAALDGFHNFPPILDTVENYPPQQNDVFVCPLGNPKYKKIYAEKIAAKGGEFINIIHPTAVPNEHVRLGKGILIHSYTIISPGVQIGDMVTLQSHHIIGHDAQIGAYSQLGSFAFIGGFTTLGECSFIGPGAVVIDRIKIGENSTVGAGSVVIKNVKPATTVFGNPARLISA